MASAAVSHSHTLALSRWLDAHLRWSALDKPQRPLAPSGGAHACACHKQKRPWVERSNGIGAGASDSPIWVERPPEAAPARVQAPGSSRRLLAPVFVLACPWRGERGERGRNWQLVHASLPGDVAYLCVNARQCFCCVEDARLCTLGQMRAGRRLRARLTCRRGQPIGAGRQHDATPVSTRLKHRSSPEEGHV